MERSFNFEFPIHYTPTFSHDSFSVMSKKHPASLRSKTLLTPVKATRLPDK